MSSESPKMNGCTSSTTGGSRTFVEIAIYVNGLFNEPGNYIPPGIKKAFPNCARFHNDTLDTEMVEKLVHLLPCVVGSTTLMAYIVGLRETASMGYTAARSVLGTAATLAASRLAASVANELPKVPMLNEAKPLGLTRKIRVTLIGHSHGGMVLSSFSKHESSKFPSLTFRYFILGCPLDVVADVASVDQTTEVTQYCNEQDDVSLGFADPARQSGKFVRFDDPGDPMDAFGAHSAELYARHLLDSLQPSSVAGAGSESSD
jgi:hypothetical protein